MVASDASVFSDALLAVKPIIDQYHLVPKDDLHSLAFSIMAAVTSYHSRFAPDRIVETRRAAIDEWLEKKECPDLFKCGAKVLEYLDNLSDPIDYSQLQAFFA